LNFLKNSIYPTIFLIINAMNPELVDVPNVVGISFRQAKAAIEARGLKIGKLEYVRDIALNNVMDLKYKGWIIKPGMEIPKFSAVDLVLGNGYGYNQTYMPDLTGLQTDEAKEKIIDAYCNLGSMIYDYTIRTQEDTVNAFVFRQFPEYSEKRIKYGTYIDIWLTLDVNKIFVEDTTGISEAVSDEN